MIPRRAFLKGLASLPFIPLLDGPSESVKPAGSVITEWVYNPVCTLPDGEVIAGECEGFTRFPNNWTEDDIVDWLRERDGDFLPNISAGFKRLHIKFKYGNNVLKFEVYDVKSEYFT